MKIGAPGFFAVCVTASFLLACESLGITQTAGPPAPSGVLSAQAASLTPTPPDTLPGIAWATFVRNACEWSGVGGDPGECFGTRGEGYRVRVVRLEGNRWLIWDPATRDVSYVDRDSLDVPPEVAAAVPYPLPAAKSVAVCIDRSRSYRHTERAIMALADWIKSSAHPGDVFYTRWIEENSFRPEAQIVDAIRVPVATPPVLPATPTPLPAPEGMTVNPFSRLQKAEATATAQVEAKAATAAAAAIQATISQASVAYQAALSTASTYVDQRAKALRAVKTGPAEGSDVVGCASKSAELLAGARGEKYLLIASDLEQDPERPVDFRLDGVRVRVPYFQCDDPSRCDDLRRQWRELAARAGAIDIRFLDPSQGFFEVEK